MPSNIRSSFHATFLLLCGALFASSGQSTVLAAPLITRGPYLQSATPTTIVVRWRTDVDSDSRVRFGTDPSNLDRVDDNSRLTTEHRVGIQGLTPDTKYFYEFGSTTRIIGGGDADHYFITPPRPGATKPARIWVIGDSGTANTNAAAVRDAYLSVAGTNTADLWLMLGDNAYNSGTDAEYQAAVFDMYPTVLRNTVLWPTIGNHDGIASDPRIGTGPYYSMFTLPTQGEAGGVPSGTESYYSFDYGNIHFVCLESYHTDRSTNAPMMTWLASDLASTTNLWIIAFWHHPPYSKGSHDSDTDLREVEMRENAVPILETYGVDLVLCGHNHSYERSFLIDGHYGTSATLRPRMIKDEGDGRESGDGAYRKSALPHDGAVYTVCGSSGSTSSGRFDHPIMVTSLLVLGSMILDVNDGRLDAKFIDKAGVERDEFTILKGPRTQQPVVDIQFQTNQAVVTEKFIDLSGQAVGSSPVISVVVTNDRGGSVDASLNGDDWTASGVPLKLGPNRLIATATDALGARGSDTVAVVRVPSNPVNATLRASKVKLERGTGANADSVSVAGLFNDTDIVFDPTNEAAAVSFGDYEAFLPSNTLPKLKYKAKASPTNTLTSLTLSLKKHTFAFSASGFTLTNADPFEVYLVLGTNELGPGSITFPTPAVGAGKFSWSEKSDLHDGDLFFLGKSRISSDSFLLTGEINLTDKPNVVTTEVCFGFAAYDETLPTNGWSKSGNVYIYERPLGGEGALESMELDFDRGVWRARGGATDIGSLLANPTTDVRIEIGDVGAIYRAKLVPKGTGFKY